MRRRQRSEADADVSEAVVDDCGPANLQLISNKQVAVLLGNRKWGWLQGRGPRESLQQPGTQKLVEAGALWGIECIQGRTYGSPPKSCLIQNVGSSQQHGVSVRYAQTVGPAVLQTHLKYTICA
jgi:hypothetical protein